MRERVQTVKRHFEFLEAEHTKRETQNLRGLPRPLPTSLQLPPPSKVTMTAVLISNSLDWFHLFLYSVFSFARPAFFPVKQKSTGVYCPL